MNLKEWADLHGEPKISLSQFNREAADEREYRRRTFALKLSADELDWLFSELETRACELEQRGHASLALDYRGSIRMWRADAQDQGYRG